MLLNGEIRFSITCYFYLSERDTIITELKQAKGGLMFDSAMGARQIVSVIMSIKGELF